MTLTLGKKLVRAEKVDLENHVLEMLTINDGRRISFAVGDREIVTLSLEWSDYDENKRCHG